jgi:hypothetical protein
MRRSLRLAGLAIQIFVLPLSVASAGNLNAVFNGKSFHVNATYEWNEQNYGLGLEYEFAGQARWRPVALVSGFRDSNNEMSYIAGGGLHRRLLNADRFGGLYFDAGLNAFVMTRQDVNDNKPFPGVLPSLSFGNRNVGFNLTYLPVNAVRKLMRVDMADPTISGIYFLQFKVSIKQVLPGR